MKDLPDSGRLTSASSGGRERYPEVSAAKPLTRTTFDGAESSTPLTAPGSLRCDGISRG